MQGKLVPTSFRHTVLLLVWAAVTVPLLILCIYQVRTDYQRHLALEERELAYQTDRLSFTLTQELLHLMSDLDRIASDGSVIRSLNMPVLTPISTQKIKNFLAQNPSTYSVMLVDKDLFPVEVLPARALAEDISSYEGYMEDVISSPTSIHDPRPRMFVPPSTEGQEKRLIFVRPILTAGTSLIQPFQVDGLLLVTLNVEPLVAPVIGASGVDLVRLRTEDQTLYEHQESSASVRFRHESTIFLGLDNQSLILELGRSAEGSLKEVLSGYRTQVIVVLIFIALMLVLVKTLADKLVFPLKLLSEVTASMSSRQFHLNTAVPVDTSKMQYREFSEAFELLGDMERIIGEQFQQLHDANATLEEKVKERTEALEKNIQLLNQQRNSLQRLVQYSMHVHQHQVVDELGAMTLSLAEDIGQQACGLYLLRSEFFQGGEFWQHLSESAQTFLRQHRNRLNDHLSLLALAREHEWLHLFPIGGSGEAYKGFFITERSAASDQASEAIMVLSTMLSSAISQHSLTAKLHQLAHIDSVTGLPNRHFFNARFKDKVAKFDASEASSHFGVCVVDVNGLKRVNDHFGHQHGDEMLTIVAKALKKSMRANDTVARVGGDEFYILLENVTTDTCNLFANRLATQTRDLSMMIEEERIAITFSIGFACTDLDSLKNLLVLADERMYFAKKKHYAQLSSASAS